MDKLRRLLVAYHIKRARRHTEKARHFLLNQNDAPGMGFYSLSTARDFLNDAEWLYGLKLEK